MEDTTRQYTKHLIISICVLVEVVPLSAIHFQVASFRRTPRCVLGLRMRTYSCVHKAAAMYIVTYRGDLKEGFWIGWLDLLHLIHSHTSGLQAIHSYHYFTHFTVHRCTRTRILSSLAVSWQRIYQSRCNFKSHMKSSLHRLFPFLALIPLLPIPKARLYSIPLLPNSYPGRLASRDSSLHFTATASLLGHVFYILM
jgi:hypothetical protein